MTIKELKILIAKGEGLQLITLTNPVLELRMIH